MPRIRELLQAKLQERSVDRRVRRSRSPSFLPAQRPAPEIYPARTEIPKITGQRLGSASVTRGNAAGSHTLGKYHSGDPTAWLGRDDSNFRMAESESAGATFIALHSRFFDESPLQAKKLE